MEVFLDNSWESTLIELFIHYTNFSKHVKIIKLSAEAQALIKAGQIKLSVPSLVASSTEYFTTAIAICTHIATVSGTRALLFGADYKAESNNISYLEIVKNATPEEYVKTLNQELETKTYFVNTHINFADIAVFIASYKFMTTISDDQKWEYCNFFRWFNHIQNLPGIDSFLQSNNLPKSSFPQKPKAAAGGKKIKEKKIGTQAPPKADKKQKQQQPQKKEEKKEDKKEEKKEGGKSQAEIQADRAKEKAAKKQQQKEQAAKAKKAADVPLLDAADPLFFEQNLDIRVGEIKKVWPHETSEKLWCEEIDVGEPELRQIASGLQEIIPKEGMTGKVCVMTNLKPRTLRGFKSNGMVMCSSSTDKSVVQILRPPADAKVGQRIMLEGLEGKFRTEKLDIQKEKLKILEKAFPLLKSDDKCNATYAGVRFVVDGKYCNTEKVANGTVA